MQESTAAKLAKTDDVSGNKEGNGYRATATTTAVESRQTSFGIGLKQRTMRPAASGCGPPTQRAVLRIAQPDGTVCFLAIDNVSDISRLPVTAVVQQLLASQKQASANHRLSLGTPGSAGLVSGFAARTPVPQVSTMAGHAAPVLTLPPTTSVCGSLSQSVCSGSTSLHNSTVGSSSVPPTSVGTGVLPSLPVSRQLPQFPVLRAQNPSVTNSLSAAFNRFRSQNALAQLFQNRALNLRSIAGQSVNSQQLLNNIMAIRAAALASTAPPTCSSTCRILPVVADRSVAFAVPAALTVPSELHATTATITSPQPSSLSSPQLPYTGKPGCPVTMPSSSGNQKLLLLTPSSQRMLGSEVTPLPPILGSSPSLQPNCTPQLVSHTSAAPSTACSSGAAMSLSSAQQITSANPSASILPLVSDVAKIATLRAPVIQRAVTESTLSLAMRAAAAASRAPNVPNPLNRPQQPRYVNNLTVKTLLENRVASTAESPAASSAVTVTQSSVGAIGCVASSVESNRLIIRPSVQSFRFSVSSSLPTQASVHRTGTVGSTGVVVTSIQLSTQQLTGQPMLALLPAGVKIGPAQLQQLVAVSAAAVSVTKPGISPVSVAQLMSQATARPSLMSGSVDVGALQAIIPHSKSRAPPSRPVRNNTRTTSVMKAPIPALPRLTDLGLAASSADHAVSSSSATVTVAVSSVNLLATSSAMVAQNQAPSISTGSASTSTRTFTTACSVIQPAVALVEGGNKTVIMAARTSTSSILQPAVALVGGGNKSVITAAGTSASSIPQPAIALVGAGNKPVIMAAGTSASPVPQPAVALVGAGNKSVIIAAGTSTSSIPQPAVALVGAGNKPVIMAAGTSASPVPQPAVALVGGRNKPVIMAAGTSSLVVPASNNPGQVFLLQSADGNLVQLVQLPAVAAVKQSVTTRPSLLNQQVVLAPNTAISGSPLQLFAVSSAPATNLSKLNASVPMVQFVVCSSANITSSAMTGLCVASSAVGRANAMPACASSLPPVRTVSQQTAVVSAPQLMISPRRLPVTKPVSSSVSPDRSRPTVHQCGASSRQSTELSKSSGLAEAADLFLMAASVVDRATEADTEVDRHTTASSSSSVLTQTTR